MAIDEGGDWRASPIRVWILGLGQKDMAFDATIREAHSSELTVTENPVETGVVVADHAFMNPLRLEVEGHVGDVSLHPDPADPFASTTKRSARALELLQNLQSSAVPFIVQTGLRVYQDMVIVSLTAEQGSGNAGSLEFHATLRQIITATTQSVTYPPRKPGKPKKQAAKPVSGGEKSATAITEPARRIAILKSAFNKAASGKEFSMEDLSAGLDKLGGGLVGALGSLP